MTSPAHPRTQAHPRPRPPDERARRARRDAELASLPEFRAVIDDLPAAADVAAVYRTVAGRVTLAGDGYLAGLLKAGTRRLRGRPGRPARRVARLPPVHDLVDDDVRERGDAAARERAQPGGGDQARRHPHLPDPARPWPVPDRGPDARHPRAAQRERPLAGPVPPRPPGRAGPRLRRRGRRGSGRGRPHPPRHRRRPTTGAAAASAAPTTWPAAACTRIEPGPPRDLAYQESLTGALLKARPVYDPAERVTADDWPDAVAEILRAPVSVLSRGPAAADKTRRPPAGRYHDRVTGMPDKVLYTAEATSTGDGRNGHVATSDGRIDLDLAFPPEMGGTGAGVQPGAALRVPATPPASTARCAWSRAASTPRSATPR